MVTYKYTAISKDGAKVSGVVECFNEYDAVNRIRQDYDIILKLTEVKEKNSILSMEIGGPKLNAKAFTLMCSQFSIILRSGIPIARTVRLIADKMTDKTLKKMLQQVASDVEGGRSLADSFEERGGKFLPLTFNETIRAGEESGNVDKSFDTMYRHYDKQAKIGGKVRSALTYPAFVMVIAIAVVIVLMVKVVPTFTEIFDSYGSELPLITRILIGISDFFSAAWLPLLIIALVLVIAYKLYTNTESGRLKVAQLGLKLPVLGNINILNAASQFANTMTTMMAAGLPITRAISITARVMDNYYISQRIGKLVGRLEEGWSLGDSMREAAVMPDILVDMVSVGEETGELADTLDTVAVYYDAELEMAISSALGALEPTILVFVAGVAGFIVVAIYIAIFQLYSAMG